MRNTVLLRLASRALGVLPGLLRSSDVVLACEASDPWVARAIATHASLSSGRSENTAHVGRRQAAQLTRAFAADNTTQDGGESSSADGPATAVPGTAAGAAGPSEDSQAAGSASGDSESSESPEASEGGSPPESGGASPKEGEGEAPPEEYHYVEPEFPPLPPAEWAPWLIDHIARQRAEENPHLVLNYAGEHSSGWEIYDVDEKNLITWFILDLTGGRVPDNGDNALLSDTVKLYMFKLRTEARWSVEQIAALFAVRQQRVAAIIALKEMERSARAAGEPVFDDLARKMDVIYGCNRVEGTGERHVKLLPARPMFEVFKPGNSARQPKAEAPRRGRRGHRASRQRAGVQDLAADAAESAPDAREQQAAAGAAAAAAGDVGAENQLQEGTTEGENTSRTDEHFDEGAPTEDDPGWESELRAREEEVAAYEERIMVREFMQRLAFNTGKVGVTIRKQREGPEGPRRPKQGWSIMVRPAGRGVDYEPFVAEPGGTRRPLERDEALHLERMKPRPRRKFL